MVPPPPSMVSRTSFSEPSTPLACRSILILPPDSSSTVSLNLVSVCPTMVSNGLTSAITRVTSGMSLVSAAASVSAASVFDSSAASPSAFAASVGASVAAGAAVVASGLFKPQPAREPATIAAHNAVLIHLFFMKRVLLLILFSCFHMIFLCFLNTDFIIRVFCVSEHSKFL